MYMTEPNQNVVPVANAFAAEDRSVLNWDGINYVPQPKPEETRPMTLRLPVDLHEHYRQQAFDLRTSMSALIISALYNDAQTVKADS
jgi:hypothetical protein